ncbi:MAG: C_GCAxxG_C_C family protein [Planctomycetaceae bacterium]|nr:C_GCAxxG_C_C family protein [Planctomycetaceae bacterium]
MTAAETAVERFQNGHSCSQAVFTALAESMGLDYQTALKVASAFGGGMGRMGATCGAVTGAFMAFGLKTGGVEAEAKDETYRLVNRFAEVFRERHRSLDCRELIGCDLSTEEGREQAQARDTHGTICASLVRDAVEIAEQLLSEM